MPITSLIAALRAARRPIRGALAAALGVAASTLAWAQAEPPAPPATAESPSMFRYSGFGTLGVTHTSADRGWRASRDLSSRVGSSATEISVDSRLGLQVNANLGHDLEAAVQAVLRPHLAGSPTSDMVEWAYLAWRPDDRLTVRVGRTNPDFFLFSDVRSLGYAMPWVRPNVDFYGWLPMMWKDGLDAQWSFGGIDRTFRLGASVGRSDSSLIQPSTNSGVRFHLRDMMTLTAAMDQGPWQFKLALSRARMGVSLDQPAVVNATLDMLAGLPIPSVADEASRLRTAIQPGGTTDYIALGAHHDDGRWVLTGELNHARLPANAGGNTDHGYVSVGRRFGRWLPFAVVSASRSTAPPMAAPNWAATLAPILGPDAAAQTQALGDVLTNVANSGRFDQRNLSLGVRWDFAPRAAWKFQVDRTRVKPYGSLLWRHSDLQGNTATVFSSTVDVVF